jgi:uncharacterized membrane protein YdbT with pleckstrin-like domain
MAGPNDRHVPRELSRYLIQSESIVFVLHRHWIVLLEPILTALAGLAAVVLVGSTASGLLSRVMVVIWGLLLLRLAYHVFEWHHEMFVATNSRLMLVHGLVTRKVDIMPMTKVTDMRYDRSLIGQIFGYGVFILESAGQDQALSRINFIPDPDLHYQQISAVIFAPAGRRPPERLSPAGPGSAAPISEPDQAWWRRS